MSLTEGPEFDRLLDAAVAMEERAEAVAEIIIDQTQDVLQGYHEEWEPFVRSLAWAWVTKLGHAQLIEITARKLGSPLGRSRFEVERALAQAEADAIEFSYSG